MQKLIDERVHDYYWNHDFPCAITTLKVLAEIFNRNLPPELIEATFGLNAGRLGLQCGLVQGTLLFIGLLGSQTGTPPAKIKELCLKYVNAFQAEFGSMQCQELRPAGFSPNNPPHLCENLTKRSLAYSARFIAQELKA